MVCVRARERTVAAVAIVEPNAAPSRLVWSSYPAIVLAASVAAGQLTTIGAEVVANVTAGWAAALGGGANRTPAVPPIAGVAGWAMSCSVAPILIGEGPRGVPRGNA